MLRLPLNLRLGFQVGQSEPVEIMWGNSKIQGNSKCNKVKYYLFQTRPSKKEGNERILTF